MNTSIVIKGARAHNLKDISISIPRDMVTVITGPSGSGKSSLAIDTIYAEGQRRYVESLSSFARQFLDNFQKPDVDYIDGLSPSIAIDQKTASRSMRSTVGTITEIYDYMRVLYTRIGQPFCYRCGSLIASQNSESIMKTLLSLPEGSRIQVLAPIVHDRKGEYRKEISGLRAEGFIRARIDGKIVDLTTDIKLKRHQRHTIEVIIERLRIKGNIERKLKLAVESALRFADSIIINLTDEDRDIPLSRKMACPGCGISYPEITPRFFSFNSRLGACPACNGLGVTGAEEGDAESGNVRTCKACRGMRLREEALNIKISDMSIAEFSALSIIDAKAFIKGLSLTKREKEISLRVLKEVTDRLDFIDKVGLGYLSLNRSSQTLSGGEAQRIRLATQLGSSLTGVLYVLDEPSLGLHPRDCRKLLESLGAIRDSGNTIIVVEHDEDTIKWADHIVDMGPGAGIKGGWVVASGSPESISVDERSLTGMYLSGKMSIPVPTKRRKTRRHISLLGVNEHNLKGTDIKIPLGLFVCVSGVSGSGKSTMVLDVLYRALRREVHGSTDVPGSFRQMKGHKNIEHVISVEQAPLGRTPRSNPATYTGVFTLIRELFSQIPESRLRGYTASRFSFNVKGGRCEECSGDGTRRIEMHFLPDVFVPCDTCGGKRYNRQTLDITYKGKTIAEVLEMTVSEAHEFFGAVPLLRSRLEMLDDVGLGYLQLGQSAPTLSGGEAQRLRLSKELAKRTSGNTFYILDEPTTGLHSVDIEKLLNVINALVDRGNTVLVIEHNPDVLKSADYIIDMGPEGGEAGGKVVASGTPEQVAKTKGSHTGKVLKPRLK
jgi:excinuclease ABC subunit A